VPRSSSTELEFMGYRAALFLRDPIRLAVSVEHLLVTERQTDTQLRHILC